MRRILALALILVAFVGADQVQEVGGTRMAVFRIPNSTTLYITSSDLVGWSRVTSVGYKSGFGVADSLYLNLLGTDWTGIGVGQAESRSFPIRTLSMNQLESTATKRDTLAAYVNSTGFTYPTFLYLWGD